MIARFASLPSDAAFLAQMTDLSGASPSPIGPLVVLALCIVAGIGTVLLLPGRREKSIPKIGGAVLILTGLVFVGLLVRSMAGMGAYFWIFATIAIAGAIRVVTHPRPVYSALYFVMTVLASAGLFILMWAQFMAVALVLIYAGAILITYVFVIMLAANSTSSKAASVINDYDNVSREPLMASAIGFALMGVLLFVIFDKSAPIPPQGDLSIAPVYVVKGGTQELGAYLYQNQIVNLELAGVILTLAMVGAIVIARRQVWTGGVEAVVGEVTAPLTPVDDNPHSIPVYGTDNPRQKAYPET
jgi:NADH-quinone oxidoreductase subunit J